MKQPPAEERPKMPHLLTMSERSSLSVSGVRDVDNFDEQTVVVDTEAGLLTIKGHGLHISRLSVESGDLTVVGTMDSLIYTTTKSRDGGFFGSLFR